jgi:hypothetical protein
LPINLPGGVEKRREIKMSLTTLHVIIGVLLIRRLTEKNL